MDFIGYGSLQSMPRDEDSIWRQGVDLVSNAITQLVEISTNEIGSADSLLKNQITCKCGSERWKVKSY